MNTIEHEKQQDLKQRLIDAINEYITSEVEDPPISELDLNGEMGLAYTTYDLGDGVEHDIQVNFNFQELKWKNYIDEKLVLEEPVDSIDDFIEDIRNCKFEDVVRQCIYKGFDIYED